ncbi:MAG: hypothetical protein N2Z72_07670 [Bacteroidales bacterium]|nr:hypothetical protein [Bacteroidales bacterium]
MKKLSLFLVAMSFFYLSIQSQQNEANSTINDSILWQKRTDLVNDLKFYIISINDSSKKVLRKLIFKLDTFLLKEDSLLSLVQSSHTHKVDSLVYARQELENQVKKPLEFYGYYEKYKYYALGIVGGLLILWLVFMLAFIIKSVSCKKKIKTMLSLVEKANIAEEEVKKLQEELKLLKVELENKESTFRNEKNSLENQISTLIFERDDLKQKVSKIPLLESEIQQLRTEQLKNNSLMGENDNLKNEVAKLKQDLQQLNDHYTTLLAEKEQYIVALQGEIAQIKKVKDQLEKESEEYSLKPLQDENERLLIELAEIKKQLSDALSWRIDYEKKCEENQLLIQEIKNYREEIEKMKSQVHEVISREEYDQLKKQLEEEKAFRREAEEILKKFLKK